MHKPGWKYKVEGSGQRGGIWLYRTVLPQHMWDLGLSIGSWGCWNLLVAVRLWSEEWRGQTVLVFTDNWATAWVLE